MDRFEAEACDGLNDFGFEGAGEGGDAAKARAPRTFAGRTVAQRRRVFQKCFFSAKTRATG